MRLSFRRIILAILPPIVVDAIRYVRERLRKEKQSVLFWRSSTNSPHNPHEMSRADVAPADITPLPEWEMVPDSDALWTAKAGWGHQSIVSTQLKKWPSFLRSVGGTSPLGQSHEGPPNAVADYATHNTIISFGYALARAAQGRHEVSVLDWGGGLGHYYMYARVLMPTLSLEYVVKDLPPFCEAGAALLPEVTFVSEDSVALGRSYDFVFASSSLHYARKHYDLLGRLCDSAQDWLMITRLPFVEHTDDFVVLQRPHMYGYMTEYPGWFMKRAKMLDFVAARGFELVRQFLVAERPNVPNAPEQAQYYGFLFRRLAPAQREMVQS
jgi:putative methyltransferase (TIGR04325 family)